MAYQSKKDKAENYQRLKRLVSEYEQKDKIKQYLIWIGLSTEQKQQAYEVWDKYYLDCRKTKAFRLYKAMSKAVGKNDLAKVRELRGIAQQMLKQQAAGKFEIEKPSNINPHDFLQSQNVFMYKQLKQRLESLEQESKDIENSAKEIFF